MPRSRNSRSASPQKSVSAGNIAEIQQRNAVQNVHDIFCESVDIDVIRLVLQECNWKEEDAVEKLLVIAESNEEQKIYKSKLHKIAEGVFGSLHSGDYGTAGSSLSPSERVIRRPSKVQTASDKTATNTSKLKNVGSSEQLLARGLAPTFYLSGNQGNQNSTVDEIEMDIHFSQLKKKSPENNQSSASSSVSSQRSYSEIAKTPSSSKTALLSQAQSAFNQQFDDAEGTQRWEQYKQKFSEHYLINLTKDKTGVPSKGQGSAISPRQSAIPDDPAILQAEIKSPNRVSAVSTETERPRSETSRSFPVRLLSKSPDTVEDDVKTSGSVAEKRAKADSDSVNLDSADLDETVLKCIYEVQGDLLYGRELKCSSLSQNADHLNSRTPVSVGQLSINKPIAQQSNEAMTLPTIGLSVDAQEFVPRPKPTVPAVAVTSATELTDFSPQPASKVTKSSSVEVKSGVKNAQMRTPVGSPLTVSPSLSPGISPPASHMSSPAASLTGSPMFITPKWPSVIHKLNHPPPMTPPHHLSPGYRFQPGVPLPYSSRMVYTVAPPPPMFRMAGMSQYVQQPNIQIGEHIEDRAAIATGQPIMATSETSKLMTKGHTTATLVNQAFIEEKVEKVHTLQKSGLKVLVIVRGLPGSGKSTLARALQSNGMVLSTDDYFMKGSFYDYNPDKLTEAHQWNRERTKEAMKMGKSPVIIDNTNTQIWEFKPYASLALTYNYHIELMEPQTPWKYKANELARRTFHGVPQDHIERMINRYEHNITVDMLIRKRKADSKSNENGSTEEVTEFTKMKRSENSFSPGEVTSQGSRITENRGAKDLRLQNFLKTDDIRKQRSVESDSESISSYNSGSLSNQSSRNASPKPLRSSLKTPGALQKIEKLKPPTLSMPKAIKPTVIKVKNKAIKHMEEKLSSQTVQTVNDIVNEHVGHQILSVDNVKQLEDELKALLNIYPMNDSEITAAEELIGLKLHNIIYQTSEIPEDKDTDVKETSDKDSNENNNNEFLLEIPIEGTYQRNLDRKENVGKQSDEPVYKTFADNEKFSETSDDSHTQTPEKNLLRTVLQQESKTEELTVLDKNITETTLPSWKAIAHTKNDQTKDLDGGDASETAVITSNDFEFQYWGKGEKVSPTDVIENPWTDTVLDDWGGSVSECNQEEHTIDGQQNGAKPQRKKRNKSADILQDLNTVQVNTFSENDDISDNIEEITKDYECDKKAAKEKLNDESSTETVVIDQELLGNSAGSNVLNKEEIYSMKKKEKEISNDFESDHKVIVNESDDTQGRIEKSTVNDQEDETFCSGIFSHRSQFQNRIHELYQSSSLQMLKESYNDVESPSHFTGDSKVDVTDLCNTVDNEISEFNPCSHSKFDHDTSKIDYRLDTKTDEVFERQSRESLVTSETDTVNLKKVQSTESFTSSGESETDVSQRSESEFETAQHISPEKSLSSLSVQRNKKPPRRKKAPVGPFLNNDEREKFKTTSWNSFTLHGVEKKEFSPPNGNITWSDRRDTNCAMTMTDVEYFNLTARLNQGEFVDSNIKYLIGNPKKLINGLNSNTDLKNAETKDSIKDVYSLEKSTSTSDFTTLTDSESVEFLQTCFPDVPLDELACVLETCGSNTEWAINLLLDWKYSLNLSEDEKKEFAEGIAELKKRSPTNVKSHDAQDSSGPSSLLDICFNLVEKEKIASREDIERQLIQTGKERLDRIEVDNMTKIHRKRSSSFDETSIDTGRYTRSSTDLSLLRSLSSPAEIDNSVTWFSDHVKGTIYENTINENSDLISNDKRAVESKIMSDSVDESTGQTNNTEITHKGVVQTEVVNEDLDLKTALSMNIDTEVIGQLEDMFGPLGNRSDIKESLSVPLDRKTAWMMYQCIKKGLILERAQQRKEQQQLVEDEELARQLQEEENAYLKPNIRNTRNQRENTGSRTRKTPLVGLSVLGTIPQHKEPAVWNTRNKSLAEIMQEEQRIQDKQEEHRRLLEIEGGPTAMASCLKRQKLYGRFPNLDRKLLNEILEANCFNLTETVVAISSSLEETPAEHRKLSDQQQGLMSEQKLLEETKQQSVQEMLDSYIYHSVVSKDYQDGAEPEYEDYRGEANIHFRLRHECFQKAREAYRRGLKQVASFYSQQGHQHTQKIKEANMRASEHILADRNADLEKNMTLDLHGLHVEEAIAALKRIIPQKEKERCKRLTVITGRGSHSRGGVARLRPSVKAYLSNNYYSYTEVQSGVFNVSLKYRSPDR